MNLYGRVKEEFPGSGCSSYPAAAGYGGMPSMAATTPQPMEGLHDAGPPPFLTKTYDIIDDSGTNHIISWSRGNNSFIVWDPQAFSMSLLPRYFKHNNFSSFVRQLNTYGFRKVDPDRWEFANESFLRGQRHLLKNIRRRRTHQPQASSQYALDPCVEVGRFGLDGEIDRLRRDKQVLMVELVKLRQQQQNTRTCLQIMEERLRKTEMKQQQMMSFLAKAMQNPNFVQQLVQQKDRRKQLEEAINKKRRRRWIDPRSSSSVKANELGKADLVGATFVKTEPDQDYDDIADLEVSELDKLAMDLQGITGSCQNNVELEHVDEIEEHGSCKDKNLEEVFWNDLLNDDIEQEVSVLDVDEDENEEVDVLVEQLGYLGSSSN